MNSLSWLIYFIGMVDGINQFALWLAIPGTIGLAIVIVIWIIIHCVEVDTVAGRNGETATAIKELENIWKWWRVGKNLALTCWLIGWVMIITIPSRQTLLLIAGSQITETVLKSEAVQSVVNPGVDLLKTWIGEETAKLKPKPKTDK